MRTSTKLLSIAAAVAITGTTLSQVSVASPDNQYQREGQQSMHGAGMHGMANKGGMSGMRGMKGMGHSMLDKTHGSNKGGFFDPKKKVESLKKQLGITQDQEEAWSKYEKVFKDVSETKRSRHEGIDRTAMRNMSDDDRQAFRTTMQKQEKENYETLIKAATELLGSLKDEQKSKAQNILPGIASFNRGKMQHGGMAGKGGRHGARMHSGSMN